MDILTDFFSKAFRLVSEDLDVYFTVKKGEIQPVEIEEQGENQFDTFFLVPSNDVILYSLKLPAQVEENLREVVRSFVLEKEPVREGIRIDMAYIKEKGQLKVLASVIRESRYQEIRKQASEMVSELSGILPVQLLYLAWALQTGVSDGLVLFQDDETTLGAYLENGFPVSFMKCRAGRPLQQVISRFLAGLRAPEDVAVTVFGEVPEITEAFPDAVYRDLPESPAEMLPGLLKEKELPVANLLPEKERKVHRKFWRYIGVAVLVAAVGIYGTSLIRDYLHLRSEVQTLQQNYESKKKQAMKLVKKLDERDRLKAQVQFYRKLKRQKMKICTVLQELTAITPVNSYATSINIRRNNKFDFNGKSKDMYTLIRKLDESKYFTGVQKSGSSKEMSDGYTAFLIRGKIAY
ncbi:MAG: hypothetical protein GXO69_08295 [Acidobacteria bacterium]|nr:hypothetical protein [Acidobacteriota bacterium]